MNCLQLGNRLVIHIFPAGETPPLDLSGKRWRIRGAKKDATVPLTRGGVPCMRVAPGHRKPLRCGSVALGPIHLRAVEPNIEIATTVVLVVVLAPLLHTSIRASIITDGGAMRHGVWKAAQDIGQRYTTCLDPTLVACRASEAEPPDASRVPDGPLACSGVSGKNRNGPRSF